MWLFGTGIGGLFFDFAQVNVKMMMEADGWNLNEGAGIWEMN